jgi:hypothetical protein
MARTFPGDFADRAYERFCAKRDREAKCKGGDRHSHPPKQIKLQHPENNQTDSFRQLNDAEFFAKHRLARCRLRDVIDDDNLGAAAAELLSVVISRGGRKIFIPRVTQ